MARLAFLLPLCLFYCPRSVSSTAPGLSLLLPPVCLLLLAALSTDPPTHRALNAIRKKRVALSRFDIRVSHLSLTSSLNMCPLIRRGFVKSRGWPIRQKQTKRKEWQWSAPSPAGSLSLARASMAESARHRPTSLSPPRAPPAGPAGGRPCRIAVRPPVPATGCGEGGSCFLP